MDGWMDGWMDAWLHGLKDTVDTGCSWLEYDHCDLWRVVHGVKLNISEHARVCMCVAKSPVIESPMAVVIPAAANRTSRSIADVLCAITKTYFCWR